MARLIIDKKTSPSDTFDTLIADFKSVKQAYDSIEKQYTTLKDKIKSYMIDNSISEADSGDFKVKLQRVEKCSFDTDNLISFGKSNNLDFIKLVEVIDEEKLETLIYNGFVSPKELEPFQKVSVQYRLSAK